MREDNLFYSIFNFPPSEPLTNS